MDEWKCIQPAGIPQQVDATSCGVWCCINAFKIINENDIVCQDDDLPMIRYFIAEKVSSFQSKKLGIADKESYLEDMSLPLKGSLNIIRSAK